MGAIVQIGKWLWESRTYQPPWLPLYSFVALALFVVALIAPVVWHRFSKEGEKYHKSWVLAQDIKRREAELDADQFKEVGSLARSPEWQEKVGGSPPRVFAMKSETTDDGTTLQQVGLLYPDTAILTKVFIAVLPVKSVWFPGKHDTFEGGEHGVPLEDGLRKDYVKQLVDESDKLVCIGLASSEPATNNTALSDDRAVNLCRALFNIGYATEGRHKAYGMGLGEAIIAEGSLSMSLQRSVIIVGIGNSRHTPWPRDLVETAKMQTQVTGVRLDQYRRSDGQQFGMWADVKGGKLTGTAGTQWNPIEKGANALDSEAPK